MVRESPKGEVRAEPSDPQRPIDAVCVASSDEKGIGAPVYRTGNVLAVVVRHWRLGLMGLLVGIGLAGGAALFQTPIYESRTLLSLGQAGGAQLESPAVLVAVLKARYGIGSWRPPSSSLPRITSVRLDPESGLVLMVAAGRTSAGAAELLDSVVQKIIDVEKARYDEVSTLLIRRRTAVREALRSLDRVLSGDAQGPRAHGGRGALLTDLGWLPAAVAPLEGQLTDLDLKTSSLQSAPPRIAAGPTRSEHPIRPRPTLYLVIGVVGGIVLALVLAVFAEWLISTGPFIREEFHGGKDGSRRRPGALE